MTRPLRILHIADTHIGAALPARPRTRASHRGDDIIASYNAALAPALELPVDLVIHAGDLFHRAKPTQAALAAAASPLLSIAAAGIPVVIVPGNHERSALPTSLLFSHPNIHVFDQPKTYVFAAGGRYVAIAGFPCLRREAAQQFPDAVAATKWQRAGGEINILAVHQTFAGAVVGPSGFRFRTGDEVVPRDWVPSGFDYVAAGHIHRHQVLTTPHRNGPRIVYAGSTDRISFAERDEPKGAVLLETTRKRLRYRFIEHTVRPLASLPLDLTNMSQDQIRDAARDLIKPLPNGAVTALRLTGTAAPGALRGLQLSQHCRALRPDLRLTVSFRAVQRPTSRTPSTTIPAPNCIFATLQLPTRRLLKLTARERNRLPRACGVYALHDRNARLLYVGKATDLRKRVATHVRHTADHGFFAGWTRQIHTIRAIRCGSDLEARLVEADLVRRFQPPFNQQMRAWTRYVYLCEQPASRAELRLTRQPPPGTPTFGPLRSRWQAEELIEYLASALGLALCPEPADPRVDNSAPLFELARAADPRPAPNAPTPNICDRFHHAQCTGPCAPHIDNAQYAARIAQRAAFLRGESDHWLKQLESAKQPPPALARSHLALQARSDWEVAPPLDALRAAFESFQSLRVARRMLGAALWLPALDGTATRLRITNHGLEYLPVVGGAEVASSPAAASVIPRDLLDLLLTLVRHPDAPQILPSPAPLKHPAAAPLRPRPQQIAHRLPARHQ